MHYHTLPWLTPIPGAGSGIRTLSAGYRDCLGWCGFWELQKCKAWKWESMIMFGLSLPLVFFRPLDQLSALNILYLHESRELVQWTILSHGPSCDDPWLCRSVGFRQPGCAHFRYSRSNRTYWYVNNLTLIVNCTPALLFWYQISDILCITNPMTVTLLLALHPSTSAHS